MYKIYNANEWRFCGSESWVGVGYVQVPLGVWVVEYFTHNLGATWKA